MYVVFKLIIISVFLVGCAEKPSSKKNFLNENSPLENITEAINQNSISWKASLNQTYKSDASIAITFEKVSTEEINKVNLKFNGNNFSYDFNKKNITINLPNDILTNLSDRSAQIDVAFFVNSTLVSTDSASIKIDNTAPALEPMWRSYFPQALSNLNDNLRINLPIIEENTSGMALVKVAGNELKLPIVNNNLIITLAKNHINALEEKEYSIELILEDEAGNKSPNYTSSLLIDRTQPEIETMLNEASPVKIGPESLQEDGYAIEFFSTTVDKQPITVSFLDQVFTTSFIKNKAKIIIPSSLLNNKSGDYLIKVESNDKAGNQFNIEKNISIDFVKPTLIENSLSNIPETIGLLDSPLIFNIATQGVEDDQKLTLMIGNNAFETQVINNNAFFSIEPEKINRLDEGIYNISFMMSDNLGNLLDQEEIAKTILIDRTAPSLTSNLSTIFSESIDIKATVDDYNDRIISFESDTENGQPLNLTLNGQRFTEQFIQGESQITLLGSLLFNLPFGEHRIEFNTQDKAGNESIRFFDIHIGDKLPTKASVLSSQKIDLITSIFTSNKHYEPIELPFYNQFVEQASLVFNDISIEKNDHNSAFIIDPEVFINQTIDNPLLEFIFTDFNGNERNFSETIYFSTTLSPQPLVISSNINTVIGNVINSAFLENNKVTITVDTNAHTGNLISLNFNQHTYTQEVNQEGKNEFEIPIDIIKDLPQGEVTFTASIEVNGHLATEENTLLVDTLAPSIDFSWDYQSVNALNTEPGFITNIASSGLKDDQIYQFSLDNTQFEVTIKNNQATLFIPFATLSSMDLNQVLLSSLIVDEAQNPLFISQLINLTELVPKPYEIIFNDNFKQADWEINQQFNKNNIMLRYQTNVEDHQPIKMSIMQNDETVLEYNTTTLNQSAEIIITNEDLESLEDGQYQLITEITNIFNDIKQVSHEFVVHRAGPSLHANIDEFPDTIDIETLSSFQSFELNVSTDAIDQTKVTAKVISLDEIILDKYEALVIDQSAQILIPSNNLSKLPDGDITLVISISGPEGNITAIEKTVTLAKSASAFTVDITPEISSINQAFTINQHQIEFNYVSDYDLASLRVNIIDGSDNSVVSIQADEVNSIQIPMGKITSLTDGEYQFEHTITNFLGEQNKQVFPLTLDTSKPEVEFIWGYNLGEIASVPIGIYATIQTSGIENNTAFSFSLDERTYTVTIVDDQSYFSFAENSANHPTLNNLQLHFTIADKAGNLLTFDELIDLTPFDQDNPFPTIHVNFEEKIDPIMSFSSVDLLKELILSASVDVENNQPVKLYLNENSIAETLAQNQQADLIIPSEAILDLTLNSHQLEAETTNLSGKSQRTSFSFRLEEYLPHFTLNTLEKINPANIEDYTLTGECDNSIVSMSIIITDLNNYTEQQDTHCNDDMQWSLTTDLTAFKAGELTFVAKAKNEAGVVYTILPTSKAIKKTLNEIVKAWLTDMPSLEIPSTQNLIGSGYETEIFPFLNESVLTKILHSLESSLTSTDNKAIWQYLFDYFSVYNKISLWLASNGETAEPSLSEYELASNLNINDLDESLFSNSGFTKITADNINLLNQFLTDSSYFDLTLDNYSIDMWRKANHIVNALVRTKAYGAKESLIKPSLHDFKHLQLAVEFPKPITTDNTKVITDVPANIRDVLSYIRTHNPSIEEIKNYISAISNILSFTYQGSQIPTLDEYSLVGLDQWINNDNIGLINNLIQHSEIVSLSTLRAFIESRLFYAPFILIKNRQARITNYCNYQTFEKISNTPLTEQIEIIDNGNHTLNILGSSLGGDFITFKGSTICPDRIQPFVVLDNQNTYPIQHCEDFNQLINAGNDLVDDTSIKAIEPNIGDHVLNRQYYLTQNINCNETTLSPIKAFAGKFYGLGYELNNVHISSPDEDFVGLFKETYEASFYDLQINHAYIEGKQYIGFISTALASRLDDRLSSGLAKTTSTSMTQTDVYLSNIQMTKAKIKANGYYSGILNAAVVGNAGNKGLRIFGNNIHGTIFSKGKSGLISSHLQRGASLVQNLAIGRIESPRDSMVGGLFHDGILNVAVKNNVAYVDVTTQSAVGAIARESGSQPITHNKVNMNIELTNNGDVFGISSVIKNTDSHLKYNYIQLNISQFNSFDNYSLLAKHNLNSGKTGVIQDNHIDAAFNLHEPLNTNTNYLNLFYKNLSESKCENQSNKNIIIADNFINLSLFTNPNKTNDRHHMQILGALINENDCGSELTFTNNLFLLSALPNEIIIDDQSDQTAILSRDIIPNVSLNSAQTVAHRISEENTPQDQFQSLNEAYWSTEFDLLPELLKAENDILYVLIARLEEKVISSTPLYYLVQKSDANLSKINFKIEPLPGEAINVNQEQFLHWTCPGKVNGKSKYELKTIDITQHCLFDAFSD